MDERSDSAEEIKKRLSRQMENTSEQRGETIRYTRDDIRRIHGSEEFAEMVDGLSGLEPHLLVAEYLFFMADRHKLNAVDYNSIIDGLGGVGIDYDSMQSAFMKLYGYAEHDSMVVMCCVQDGFMNNVMLGNYLKPEGVSLVRKIKDSSPKS